MKKKQQTNIIKHPIISESEMRKSGTKIDKKTKTNNVKTRVVEILKSNAKNKIPMTQRMICEALHNEVREQHVNNILHALNRDGFIERFEVSKVCEDGIRRDLIYNIYIGK